MYTTLTCLQHHQPGLLIVAAIVGLYAALSSLLLARWAVPPGPSALGWVVAAAGVAGCGVWSTHFVAMLAFDPGVPVGYDIWRTVLSGLDAVIFIGVGFGLATILGRRTSGGVVAGLGVAGMHYVGMSALQVPTTVDWDFSLVVLSVSAGIVACIAAFRTGFGRRTTRSLALGSLLLALGVFALHMIAMAGLRLTPSPVAPLPEHVISRGVLGVAVTVNCVVILSCCLTGAVIHHRLTGRIAAQNARLKAMADSAFEGLIMTLDGRIVDGNEQLGALIGHSPAALVGRSVLSVAAPLHRRLLVEHMDHDSWGPRDLELLHADGRQVPVEVRARRIDIDGRGARLFVFRDMTSDLQAKAHIEYLAYHDALTGLPNRALFQDRLAHALAEARRRDEGMALIYLDLDHFKDVNDVFGHATGDELLRAVAGRLQGVVRESDTLARLGGDEFAMICAHIARQEDAARIAQRIVDVLVQPFDLNGIATDVGCSVGIALCRKGNSDPEKLLRDADMALYRCKGENRGTFGFFEEGMNIALRARKSIERDLRAADADEEFLLEYQPQVDLHSGALIGLEALLRWRHPQKGTISPAEFVPVAEESGLIIALGTWALRRACIDAAAWSEVPVAVNLSPVQFLRPGLQETIERALAESGLPAHRLEVEITERILLRDTEATLRLLRALRDRGVMVSIDDFGTGYSSLGYLHRFPFDRIKIDRSFVARVVTDSDAQAIVRAVVGLGRSLGVQTIAEGVESVEQKQMLLDEGCRAGQGFLFGRPMPADAVSAMLASGGPGVPTVPSPFRSVSGRACPKRGCGLVVAAE